MFAHRQRNTSLYFNGRFIVTVRDRITVKKNPGQILLTLLKTWFSTWWKTPCWQSQRSDVSCSWPPGLHTWEGFCPTPLCRSSQVIKVSRLTFGNLNLQLPSQIFYGTKVWRLARPLQDLNLLLLEPLLCCLGRVFWVIVMLELINDPFSMPWLASCPGSTWSIVPLMRCSCAVPLAEKHPKA